MNRSGEKCLRTQNDDAKRFDCSKFETSQGKRKTFVARNEWKKVSNHERHFSWSILPLSSLYFALGMKATGVGKWMTIFRRKVLSPIFSSSIVNLSGSECRSHWCCDKVFTRPKSRWNSNDNESCLSWRLELANSFSGLCEHFFNVWTCSSLCFQLLMMDRLVISNQRGEIVIKSEKECSNNASLIFFAQNTMYHQ